MDRVTTRDYALLLSAIVLGACVLLGAYRVEHQLRSLSLKVDKLQLSIVHVDTVSESEARPVPSEDPVRALEIERLDKQLHLDIKAREVFQKQQPAYAQACWLSDNPMKGDGSGVHLGPSGYDVLITFDANGREISRSFSPTTPVPVRDDCVSKLKMEKLSLPATGKAFEANAQLLLP